MNIQQDSLICLHAPTDVDTKLLLGDLEAQTVCGKAFEGTIGRATLNARKN